MAIAVPASQVQGIEGRLPPGPRGWPWVGCLPAFRRDQLGFLTWVARRWGPAATIGLGGRRRLFAFAAPEAVAHVLVENARNFTSREVNRPSMPFLGDGLLNLDGPAHRTERALVQPAFHRRRVEAYAEAMVQAAEDWLARLQAGATVDVAQAMRAVTLRVVAKALFDEDLGPTASAFGDAFDTVVRHRERGPWRGVHLDLPFTAYGRLRRARDRLEGEVAHLVAAHRREPREGDVLTTLVQALGGGPDGDRRVRDHAMTFLAAGHETTSNALTFTVYLLGRHPAARERLEAELDQVLRGRSPTVEDLARLTYLDLVVKESLRLYPPAWVVGRRAVDAYELLGYRFPAGSFCLISQWVVHRRPDLWPEPDRFLPERWLPEAEGGQRVVPYSYFPFGAGPRTCIGMPFALQEIKLVLATVLTRVRLEPLPGERLALEAVVTLRPRRGLRVRVVPRVRRDA